MEKYVGIVIIGRNEGERLQRCLQSAMMQAHAIVYVDSGSTDSSVAYAESHGLDVIRLDMSIPFSAGRARNAGFYHLVQNSHTLPYIQFIDGDCELVDGWIDFARQQLENNSQWAIVAGRRRERFPEHSVYNRLCDIEWNTPIGEAQACGGDFMVRVAAFLEVDGFNVEVVAGEEPELCYRLRQRKWNIFRLDHDMTLHDAAITHFSQWWRRSVRCGHAYAQGAMLHGREKEHYCFRDSLRIWLWIFFLPVAIILLTVFVHFSFCFISALYLVLFFKITIKTRSNISNMKNAILYSFYTILGKVPQLVGQLLFIKRFLLKKNITIIEYNL